MNDNTQPQNNGQQHQAPQQWHGQQPSPYAPSGQLPPAPPYLQQPAKKNWFLRHKLLTGIGAVLLIGGIATSINGGGGGTSNAADTSTSSSSTSSGDAGNSSVGAAPVAEKSSTSAAPKKDDTPGLNTAARDGKFEFKVTKVQTGVKSIGDEYLNQKAQGQYVLITVTVTNIGDKPQTMFDSNQKLTDAQGRTFSPDSGAAIYMKDNDIWMKEINPGNTMTGTLVFDMPVGAKPASIELHDSMFSGGTKVSLTK